MSRITAEFEIDMPNGESVLIDNRGGAGGTLGGAITARAEPDGYTWLVPSTAACRKNFFPKRVFGSSPYSM